MASCMGELFAKEGPAERNIARRKRELVTTLRNLESLLERTEMKMSAAVRRIDSLQVEVNEIREERNLACQIVADLEGDVQSENIRAAVLASRRRSSSLTRSRGGIRHQRKLSLDNIQRVLLDRGIEVGDDFLNQITDGRRTTVISPTPISWVNSQQRLEFQFAGGGPGGVKANSKLAAFLAK